MEGSPERTHSASWTVGTIGLIFGACLGLAAFVVPTFAEMYPDGKDLGRSVPRSTKILIAVPTWGWLALAGASVASGLLAGYGLRRNRLTDGQQDLLRAATFLFILLFGGFVIISLFWPMATHMVGPR